MISEFSIIPGKCAYCIYKITRFNKTIYVYLIHKELTIFWNHALNIDLWSRDFFKEITTNNTSNSFLTLLEVKPTTQYMISVSIWVICVWSGWDSSISVTIFPRCSISAWVFTPSFHCFFYCILKKFDKIFDYFSIFDFFASRNYFSKSK